MAGHLMLLAAFLMHPPPVAGALGEYSIISIAMTACVWAKLPVKSQIPTPQMVPAFATTQPTCVTDIPGLSA